MQHSLKVIELDPRELIPNQLNADISGDLRKSSAYHEIYKSAKICGILQPLIITKIKHIRSGNVRRQVAIDLGLSVVPCLIEIDTDELHNVGEAENKGQIIDDYKTVSHDLNKGDTPYSRHMRIKILEAYYGIRQGVRSDKVPGVKQAKEERDKIATPTERTQLKTIEKNLELAFPNDAEKQKEYWVNVGTGKSVIAAVKETKMLAVKAQEPEDLGKRFDYITDQIRIYNQTCLDLAHIPSKSTRAVIGSPPYQLMKPPQKGFENELGQEQTAKQYALHLLEHYLPCKRILLDDGSIWVVINEGIKNGSYTGAVEWFIVLMLDAGFLLNDVLIWAKNSTQPSGGNRSTRNFEYILQFTLRPVPKCDFTWLNEFEPLKDNVFGVGAGIKLTSFIHLNDGFVKTSMANTGRLREACEKEGFYLEHSSTYPPEIPFVCIKTSCQKGDHIVDLFNGCGNTAKAALYADMGITYHGFEINPVSIRASKINIEMDFGKQSNSKTKVFKPNKDNPTEQVA